MSNYTVQQVDTNLTSVSSPESEIVSSTEVNSVTDTKSEVITKVEFTEPRYVEGVMDSAGIGYPLEMAKAKIPLRSDLAEIWVDHYTMDDDEVGQYFSQYELDFFFDPKYAPIVEAMKLYFLPLDDVIMDHICETMGRGKLFEVSKQSQDLLQDLKAAISLFPELEQRLGFTSESKELLKLPEVARMLSISESKLRKLAMDDVIKSTKSLGDTGHYRFKREWVRDYVESRNV